MSHPVPTSAQLVGHNEAGVLSRWEWENRARALAHAVPLGDGTVLCRVMGAHKIYVPANDVGFAHHIMMEGMWEGWLTVFMARQIKPGMVLLDVGANHGYYTLLFSWLTGPTGRVVAYEPHPRTAELLRRTLVVNGFTDVATVHELAVSASPGGTLSLFFEASEPKNARLVDDLQPDHPNVVRVGSTTLDAIMQTHSRVDFLKIDVEGAEEAVIQGAWGLLARDKPAMVLEFNVQRCRDPEGLLVALEGVYGSPREVNYEGGLDPVERHALLDRDRTQDWLLYFSVN